MACSSEALSTLDTGSRRYIPANCHDTGDMFVFATESYYREWADARLGSLFSFVSQTTVGTLQTGVGLGTGHDHEPGHALGQAVYRLRAR